MIGALREALDEAGVAHGELTAVGRRLARRRSTTRPARSRARATCPTGRARTRCAEKLEAAFGAPVALSNDVNVATNAEFELGAAQAVPLDARRLLGHRRRRRARARRPAVGGPRRGRRDRPHRRQVRRPRAARAAGSAAWRPTRAAARWRRTRARRSTRARRPILFEIMEEKGKPRLSSGIWARALERDDKLAHQIDRPRGRRDRRRRRLALNLLDVEAVVDRRRARDCGSASPTWSGSARR